MEIKEQKVFICPYSGKSFKTKRGAEESAKKCELQTKEKEYNKIQAAKTEEILETQRNFIRLNAKSIKDFKPLIEEKAKEFYGWDVKIDFSIRFGNISNSHRRPLNGVENWNRDKNKPLSYLGWSGQVKGFLKNYVKTDCISSISDVLFRYNKGFKGFHTSCGCPGTVNDSGCNMDIGFYCFLDDFPLIKANYEIYLENKNKLDKYAMDIDEVNNDAYNWAAKQQDVVDLENKIEELTSYKQILESKYQETFKINNPVSKPVITEGFNLIKADFE
jgi:hypothetical protein